MKLQGKVAVITGGNSGIGLATAQLFRAHGAHIVIFGRNAETLDAAVSVLGGDTLAVQGDAANLSDLDRLVAETLARFGRVDALVVNAGIAKFIPAEQVDEAFFDETVGINFKGAYFTVQKFLPHLAEGGAVTFVTSIADSLGMAGATVYGATKAALRSLTRTFAAELSGRGVRVNTLSPGPIETPIYDRMGLPEDAKVGFKSGMAAQNPLKRFGTSEEVAQALYFLTAEATYTNGAELVVDGGFSQL